MLLVLTLTVFSLTACQLTIEDLISLYFCGIPTLSTCREWIMGCDCTCGDSHITTPDGERIDCNRSNCLGEAYNGCFGCIWEGGLKDCSPSKLCDSCSGSDVDDGYGDDYYGEGVSCDGSESCDDCLLDCIDACIYGN